jgi:hypothetical protein
MHTEVTVFNRRHFPIEVEGYTFKPGKVTKIRIDTNSMKFRSIRTTTGLRVNRENNEKYMPLVGEAVNMVFDDRNQHAGHAYRHAIEALADPMLAGLRKLGVNAGYASRPTVSINVRFFSSYRINQQGKAEVGPKDVFYSHGIGDKNYWTADKIEDYSYVMVPGPAWKERIEAGGFEGEIFVTGYTKLDPVFWGEYQKQKRDKPYVVWAPTHGYNYRHKGRSSYPWCVDLINEIPEEYETCLAMHPTTRMNAKQNHDISLQELVDADVVIADAGSTLYEAWILGKPVIFPDWLCKNDVLAHFKSDPGNLEYQIYEKGIGYHAKDMAHLVELIDVALNKGMQQQEQEFIESICPEHTRGKAGDNCAAVLKGLIT